MSWKALFERAAEYDVTPETVSEVLATRRDD